MTKPYEEGEYWYIQLDDGSKIEFENDNEAYEYYRAYQNDN